VGEIDFPDGFDTPEPLAWGLTPAQLGTVAAGAVLAYLALHSPLPRIAAVPLALIAVAAGLTFALARKEGRILISWAVTAGRFWSRRRRGLLVLAEASRAHPLEGQSSSPGRASASTPALEHAWRPPDGGWRRVAGAPSVETSRRVPLVLLPEPMAGSRGREVRAPAEADPSSAPPLALLGVADSAVVDAPARRGAGMDAAAVETPARGGLRTAGVATGTPTEAQRATRRLTFFSLAGGTGRTTLAVEVAGLLAGQAHRGSAWGMLAPPRVALVDLDLMSPRAGIRLGLAAPTDWCLADAGPAAPAVDRMLTTHPCGLVLVPGPARLLPAGCSDDADLVQRTAATVGELERRGCDTIVLDVGRDLSALTRWALRSAHDIFVVVTPTGGGVLDAYRSTEALRRLGLRDRLRYVVNRSHGEPALDEAMADLGGAIAAEIPDDPDLERAETNHRLLGLESSGPTATALQDLASTVDSRFLSPPLTPRMPAARRILRRRVV
jgi:MinD-like ATPase involved in chromosome partitioning or flagellar assembly